MSERLRDSSDTPAARERRRRLLWPLVVAALIFAASNQPHVAGPPGVPFMDKLVHFLVYGLLATLVVRALRWPARRWQQACVAVALASLYGISDEFHQSFTPGRSVEVADWVADTLGATVAVVAYCRWTRYRQWLEHGVGEHHRKARSHKPGCSEARQEILAGGVKR